jgi:hypothetical protein
MSYSPWYRYRITSHHIVSYFVLQYTIIAKVRNEMLPKYGITCYQGYRADVYHFATLNLSISSNFNICSAALLPRGFQAISVLNFKLFFNLRTILNKVRNVLTASHLQSCDFVNCLIQSILVCPPFFIISLSSSLTY